MIIIIQIKMNKEDIKGNIIIIKMEKTSIKKK